MTTTIPKLTASQAKAYNRMAILADEISRLNATIEGLKEEKSMIAVRLDDAFLEHDTELMRINSKLVLRRVPVVVEPKVVTPDMVGQVIRQGYSFTKWKEVQG